MITDYNKCTGCGLCVDVCPQKAVVMEKLHNTHYYPKIDTVKCTNCNLCKKVCPSETNIVHKNMGDSKCFAVMAEDEIRLKSSSGGVFYLLAETVISMGGIVFGAAFENGLNHHTSVDKMEDISRLCTSKYVKSNTDNIYSDVIRKLQLSKVLFAGTPCQVNALRNVVPKDLTDNLFTVDILCMGVPSEFTFNKYMEEEFDGENIRSINFRNKKHGWSYKLNLQFETENHSEEIDWNDSSYYYLFLKAISLRESCYRCKFTDLQRTGDITLGDFWRIWDYDRSLDDRKGTSLVLVNTPKGEELLNSIKAKVKVISEVPVSAALIGNNALCMPAIKPVQRKDFLLNIEKKKLKSMVDDMKREKADCGIFNYWYANDHGAILTAYALQTFLYEIGYSSKLINSCPESILPSRENGISERFEKRYLNSTSEVYNSFERSKELNEKFDCFLVGSDQVFRAEWVPNAWFLGFCDKGKGKMSISASFGTNEINCSDERKALIGNWLSDFDYLSVREKGAVDLMNTEFGLSAELIVDPVFYVDYENLIAESTERGEYNTVVYVRDISPDIEDMIERVSGNKKVFYIDENVEVTDFLAVMSSCKNVITDSYHGLCFSLIFNKNVISIVNQKRGAERFHSLKQQFGLPDEMFCEIDSISAVKSMNVIEYSEIQKRISKISEDSKRKIQSHIDEIFKQKRELI